MSELEHELASQPKTWREAVALAPEARDVLPPAGARVAVVGCGTSFYMAQSVAALREVRGLGETDPFTASEMPADRRYDAVIVISRSGTTTEVVRLLQLQPAETPSLAITAAPDSPVVEAATQSMCLEFADERSVVQTRFATAALALFRAAFGEDLSGAIADAEQALVEPLPFDPAAFRHFVFLGRGWTVGLANEAALKLREACRAWTESYPAMEYRHGPISVAELHSVVWTIGDVESELLDQIAHTDATVVRGDLDPLAELVRVHRVAAVLAGLKGLDPDKPRHLSRSIVLP